MNTGLEELIVNNNNNNIAPPKVVHKEKADDANENTFWNFVKIHEGIIAVSVTMAGVLLSGIYSALDYYFTIKKFNMFNISMDVFSDFVNQKRFVGFVVQFIAIGIPIIISLFIFYKPIKKHYEKTHKYEKPIAVPIWMLVAVALLLTPINALYFSLFSFSKLWIKVVFCLLFGITESFSGAIILTRIISYTSNKKSFSRKVKIWFFAYYFFVAFIIMIIVSASFHFSIGGTYQITNIDDLNYAIIVTNEEFAILEECYETDNNGSSILKVNTNRQMIVSLDRLSYEVKSFDKLELEGNK